MFNNFIENGMPINILTGKALCEEEVKKYKNKTCQIKNLKLSELLEMIERLENMIINRTRLMEEHIIIDKEVGWKNFRSFISSNVHHDSETSIEVVKTHLNQCRIECTDLLDIDFGEKGSICIQRDQVELLTEKFRYFLYFESNIQPMMDIDF